MVAVSHGVSDSKRTHLQWWDVWVGDIAMHILDLRQISFRYMNQLWCSNLASQPGITVLRWWLIILIMILRKRKRREDKGRGERVGDRQDNQNDAGTSDSLNTPRGVYETVWTNITSTLWWCDWSIFMRSYTFLKNQPIKLEKLYFIFSFTRSDYLNIIAEAAFKSIRISLPTASRSLQNCILMIHVSWVVRDH